MLFFEQLLKLRKEHGLEQTDVAKTLGVSVRTYQRYEYGEKEPQLSTLIALAELYDIPLDTLVFGEDSKWELVKRV